MAERRNSQGSKKRQFIIFGLCSLVALALCLVTLVVVTKQVERDGIKEDNTASVDYEKLAAEKGEAVKYIYDLTEKAFSNRFVKVNSFTDVSIDDSSIIVDGSQNSRDAALFKFFKNNIIGIIDSYYAQDEKGEFGVVSDSMPLIDLASAENLRCDSSVGLRNENGDKALDDNGKLIDEEYYYLTFGLKGEDIKNLKQQESFGLVNAPDVEKLIIRDLAGACDVSALSVTRDAFEIKAKVKLTDDTISYIEIHRLYKIKADLNFVDKLSSFGKKTVEFDYKVIERFEYSYAGVELSPEEIYLDVGEESPLTVNAVIEDDSDYKVSFSSSDKAAASVDEMGYVKGIAESDNPVVITVTLEYLGETFSDECIVYVGENNEEVLL